MTEFLQATVRGISTGSIYGLLALGFVIIYKSTQVLSFAQRGLTILGAFWGVYFASELGLNFWIAAPLAIALAGVLGVTIERLVLRPMVGKPVFSVAILTIGLDIVLVVIAANLISVDIRTVNDPWGLKTVSFGDVVIPQKDVATIIAAALSLVLFTLFFRYSRFGLAMRATAADQEVSLAQGITVTRVFASSWALAAMLAALAGILLGAGTGVAPAIGTKAIRALPAAVVGGLDSITGAIVGGLLIGLIEGYVTIYQADYLGFLGNNFSDVVAWVVMFAVLLVRPYGLFGTREVERV
ncbi:MAG: branched-chain amino acid ABC transporter permease [Acidimicrobiia bacterium]